MSRGPGIFPGIDEDVYHGDPAFSQSQAKTLLKSPARYQWLRQNPPAPKAEFDKGHAVHAKVLGVGLDIAVIPDELLASNGAVSTKAAKEFMAEARAAGQVPLKSDVAREIDAMAESVLRHPQARALLELEGEVEVSMWWEDPETGIACRGRVDKLAVVPDGLINVDLKSTTDASLYGFTKSCADYAYHMQGAAYDEAVRLLTGGDAPTVLIAVEKEPPYLVATFEFNAADLDRGLEKWRAACELLARCRELDEWPGHPEHIQTITLPTWA